ncbi:hypothetical protein BDC45DRAFT_531060 [Circinella umbellata]|nr:hypothetical protein BDC45DRAFT_531060 [Circinella umbellata]
MCSDNFYCSDAVGVDLSDLYSSGLKYLNNSKRKRKGKKEIEGWGRFLLTNKITNKITAFFPQQDVVMKLKVVKEPYSLILGNRKCLFVKLQNMQVISLNSLKSTTANATGLKDTNRAAKRTVQVDSAYSFQAFRQYLAVDVFKMTKLKQFLDSGGYKRNTPYVADAL